MRINSITLHNYRQYKDVTLTFSKKPCDLHIMLAEGGCGKSTLLNALEWCLYGRESHRQKANTELRSMPRYNLAALEELRGKPKKEDRIWVQIEFANEKGRYRIQRTQRVSIDPVGDLFESPDTTPTFVRFGTGMSVPSPINDDVAQEEIYRFLPEDVSKFFFFDGEQLHNFFAQAPDMTKAVENISRVDLVKRCIDHLDSYTRDLRKEASRMNPDLAGLEDKINQEEKELKQQQEELSAKIKDRDLADAEVKRLSSMIKGFDSLQAYEKQRDEAKAALSRIDATYRKFMNERCVLTREYLTLFNLFPSMLKVHAYIAEAKKKNQLPPPVDKSLLKQFLEKGVCGVCGHKLTSDAKQHIEELISLLAVGTKVSHRLSEIDVSIAGFIDKVRQYPKAQSDMRWRFKQLEDEKSRQERLFAEAEDYLGSCGDANAVKQAIVDRQKFEHALKRLQDDIPYYRLRIENLEKKLEADRAEYTTAMAKARGLEELKARMEFLDLAQGGFSTVLDQMVEEVRTRIESETNDRLGRLMWKKEYGTFRLTKEYKVDLISKYKGEDIEYSIMESRSAGEFNVLALAFTLALHSCSGFESFLCIDTPVARLSPKFRERVAPILAQIARESQTILLFTPSEYSSEIREVFSREAATIKRIDIVNDEVTVEEVRK